MTTEYRVVLDQSIPADQLADVLHRDGIKRERIDVERVGGDDGAERY